MYASMIVTIRDYYCFRISWKTNHSTGSATHRRCLVIFHARFFEHPINRHTYLYARNLRETLTQTRGRMRARYVKPSGIHFYCHSKRMTRLCVGVNARHCACARTPIVFRSKREETSNKTNSITVCKFSIGAIFDKSYTHIYEPNKFAF